MSASTNISLGFPVDDNVVPEIDEDDSSTESTNSDDSSMSDFDDDISLATTPLASDDGHLQNIYQATLQNILFFMSAGPDDPRHADMDFQTVTEVDTETTAQSASYVVDPISSESSGYDHLLQTPRCIHGDMGEGACDCLTDGNLERVQTILAELRQRATGTKAKGEQVPRGQPSVDDFSDELLNELGTWDFS